MSKLIGPTHRRPTTPGETLVEEFLEPLGISQLAFSKQIGVTYARLNSIVKGKRSVTTDTALRFERALGMDAQFWLNLQTKVDLYDAKHGEAAKEIKKIKPIRRHAA